MIANFYASTILFNVNLYIYACKHVDSFLYVCFHINVKDIEMQIYDDMQNAYFLICENASSWHVFMSPHMMMKQKHAGDDKF